MLFDNSKCRKVVLRAMYLHMLRIPMARSLLWLQDPMEFPAMCKFNNVAAKHRKTTSNNIEQDTTSNRTQHRTGYNIEQETTSNNIEQRVNSDRRGHASKHSFNM
jgi:hypothetical protein